jgi:hypothetical protein
MKIFNLKQSGMASIPTVVVLTLLIVSAAALVASISISDNLSTAETNNSDKALNYAQLGAKDALERIVRNKDYTGTYNIEMVSGGCAAPYAGCATVTVDAASNPKNISAEGRLKDIQRRIQVGADLDSNGLITSYTWKEL